jgi:hypothetical protein
MFYPWFTYVKEWERFTKAHPKQILNLFYEDLKEVSLESSLCRATLCRAVAC